MGTIQTIIIEFFLVGSLDLLIILYKLFFQSTLHRQSLWLLKAILKVWDVWMRVY